jgi:hypothetical protein
VFWKHFFNGPINEARHPKKNKKKKRSFNEPTINRNRTTINLTSSKVCITLDLAFNPPSNQMIGFALQIC